MATEQVLQAGPFSAAEELEPLTKEPPCLAVEQEDITATAQSVCSDLTLAGSGELDFCSSPMSAILRGTLAAAQQGAPEPEVGRAAGAAVDECRARAARLALVMRRAAAIARAAT